MLVDHAMDGQHIQNELAFCREVLLQIANAKGIGTAIPLAGSATAANEAAIQTLVAPEGTLLVYSNGIFGDRLGSICRAIRLPHRILRQSSVVPLQVSELSAVLDADPSITHVMVVHCETSSGIINPVEQIAELCKTAGKRLLIDAVSSFGALPIDLATLQCEALILGTNKCLQGPPGLAWIIADEKTLHGCEGNARSLCLDLWDQWRHFELHQSFRFTPPTHVIVAFAHALREYQKEGGQKVRLQRYSQNRDCLVSGLRQMGFKPLLSGPMAAPMVAAFYPPDWIGSDPIRFSQHLADHGFCLSLRRAAVPNTLRFGCMGNLTPREIAGVVKAIGRVFAEIGSARPAMKGEKLHASSR